MGKLFEKLLADNNIENFPYENIIKKMILEEPQERISSFLDIKNIIRKINRQYEVVPQNLKQNYQDLIMILDNIIATKNENSILYNYDEIINNLEKLLECNMLNDKIDNVKFFAECFISNLAEWYPKRKQVSIVYIDNLLNWLKKLDDIQKEQFIKNLHFKLSNYKIYQDLPF